MTNEEAVTYFTARYYVHDQGLKMSMWLKNIGMALYVIMSAEAAGETVGEASCLTLYS